MPCEVSVVDSGTHNVHDERLVGPDLAGGLLEEREHAILEERCVQLEMLLGDRRERGGVFGRILDVLVATGAHVVALREELPLGRDVEEAAMNHAVRPSLRHCSSELDTVRVNCGSLRDAHEIEIDERLDQVEERA